MPRAPLAVLLLVPLLAAAIPTAPAAEGANAVPVFAGRYEIVVDGERALGWVGYPTQSEPTTLLVFGHGCCGKPNQLNFVRNYASAYGVAVVAMDYRGPGGWDVWKGHEDLIAATEDLQARFPIARTVIWGISMGGETTGMAVAARPDLYDYWVDTFGVTNLFQEFLALGLWPGVQPNPSNPGNPTGSAIVRETGGFPWTVPEEYAKRSPALRTAEMQGITRAYIVHGVGDLIVQYSQSRETFENLRAAGVPVSLYTVTTGWGGVQGAFVPNVGTPSAPYCTGATGTWTCVPPSACTAHPAGTTCMTGPAAHDGRGGGPAYGVVDQLLRGREPDAGFAWREHVVDYTAGRVVSVPQ